MKSFFFVPASKLTKIPGLSEIGINNIIIDFEDSILSTEKERYLNEFKKIKNFHEFWIRIPVREKFEDEIDLTFLTQVYKLGVKKFVLPKIKSSNELVNLVHTLSKANFLVLVEHPRLLIELKNIFLNKPQIVKSIIGLGLGSHDLMTFLGADHDYSQLDYPRKKILYLAKAYGLIAIDIASMNINHKKDFIEEIEYAIMNGFDGKFIIHPNQFNWMKTKTELTKEKLFWARNILSKLPKNYDGGSIEPFVLDDEIIEKPHVLKALEILNIKKNGE